MTKDNPLNLPWHSERTEDNWDVQIYSKNGEYVGAITEDIYAAYIVRCCNMFPELITTLERLAGDDTEAKLLLERAKHD